MSEECNRIYNSPTYLYLINILPFFNIMKNIENLVNVSNNMFRINFLYEFNMFVVIFTALCKT